jgi:hypothetical protein
MAKRPSNKGASAPATNPATVTADAAAIVGEQGAAENATNVEAAPEVPAEVQAAPAATPAPEAAPAKPTKAPPVIANGVQRPRAGGKCAAVWEITEALATGEGDARTLPTIEQVKAAAQAQGLNPTNVSIEYYRCRTFHGVRGRQPKPAPAQQ